MTVNAIILAVGKKGSGKTHQLQKLAARSKRLLVADPEAKWPVGPGDEEIRGARMLSQFFADTIVEHPLAPFRVIYRDDVEPMKVAAPAWAYALRNVTLCIDELAWVCSARGIPPYLLRCIQFGRERRINLLGTTRVPQEIYGLLFDQADLVYLFQMNPGNGYDVIARRYPDVAAELTTLPPWKCRTWGESAKARLVGREIGRFSNVGTQKLDS